MVLLPHVQVPQILFLQELCIYTVPLLVFALLRLQRSGKLTDKCFPVPQLILVPPQTVFDPMFISVYNLFYTSLPVLALGVFEQDVSDKNSLEFPRLYTPGLKSELFNIREFIYSVLHGAFTSLVLFLIPYGVYKDGVSANGFIVSDHMTLGAVVATILIVDNTAQVSK